MSKRKIMLKTTLRLAFLLALYSTSVYADKPIEAWHLSVGGGTPIIIDDNELEFYSGLGHTVCLSVERRISKHIGIHAAVTYSSFKFSPSSFRQKHPLLSNTEFLSATNTWILTGVVGIRNHIFTHDSRFDVVIDGGIGAMDGKVGHVAFGQFERQYRDINVKGIPVELGVEAKYNISRYLDVFVRTAIDYQFCGEAYRTAPIYYMTLIAGLIFTI
jgi:hypothetical protein